MSLTFVPSLRILLVQTTTRSNQLHGYLYISLLPRLQLTTSKSWGHVSECLRSAPIPIPEAALTANEAESLDSTN